MKKVLLAGTALLGLALTSAPAAAELNLDLGGHFRGYGVYADDDNTTAAGAQDFDFRRDTEVHFTGEATSDNGLTVGVHYELALGGNAVETDEAYAYFAGNWGRTNFGKEDGAAYLLQVAAPSADSNVDGLRTQIQGFDGGVTDPVAFDYDHADFRGAQRLTYLTPKFSGFQAGVSYAPEDADNASAAGVGAIGSPNALAADDYKNLFEGAVRWDGEFEGFGLSAGAGYSTAEVDTAGIIDGDLNTWNAGLNVAFQGFSVGAAYLSSEQDLVGGGSADSDTWVVGAAWDNGPYHVGASYLNADLENGLTGDTTDADRWTVGAGYTYGPGMSFRGAVAIGEANLNGAGDEDFTQVTIGTDIQF